MGFYHTPCLFFPWGMGRGPHDRFLLVFDQKIPGCLIKILFLGKAETTIRSDIKARCGIMDISTSDAIFGLWFSL